MPTLVESVLIYTPLSQDVAGLVVDYSFDFTYEAKNNGFFASLDKLLRINHKIITFGIEDPKEINPYKRYYYLYFTYGTNNEDVYVYLKDIREIPELKLPIATNYYFYGPSTTFPKIKFNEEENKENKENKKITADLSELKELKVLGDECFYNCYKLTSIILPNVIKLGNYCFFNCHALKEINLPFVEKLGDDCFQYCINLKEIILPNVTVLGNSCFSRCINLKEIILPNVTNLGYECFVHCPLKSFDLTKVIDIGTSCFLGCDSLIEVKWSKHLVKIPDFCFSGCTKLKNFIYENNCIPKEGDNSFSVIYDNIRHKYLHETEPELNFCSLMGGGKSKKKPKKKSNKLSKKKSKKKSNKLSKKSNKLSKKSNKLSKKSKKKALKKP